MKTLGISQDSPLKIYETENVLIRLHPPFPSTPLVLPLTQTQQNWKQLQYQFFYGDIPAETPEVTLNCLNFHLPLAWARSGKIETFSTKERTHQNNKYKLK